MLANITRKLCGRHQSSGSLLRWVIINLWMLAPFVKAATTLRMTASIANVWKRKVNANALLLLRQVSDIKSW